MSKKNVLDFQKMVIKGEKFIYLTAYDYLTARMMEKAEVDMILVGDSLGMACYGHKTTHAVTMDDMIRHCQAVHKGAPNTFIVGDLPFMSYQVSDEQAVENAGRLIKETGVDAVKLEGGGQRILERIKAINEAGILVMGHLGLTPQTMGKLGGFKTQGRSAEAALKIVKEAEQTEDAGAFSILLEALPSIVAKVITERANIPIFGVGAGPYTHGQAVTYADMVGLYDSFMPRFVKKYANVGEIITKAFVEFKEDVISGQFPEEGVHTYSMPEDEIIEFNKQFIE